MQVNDKTSGIPAEIMIQSIRFIYNNFICMKTTLVFSAFFLLIISSCENDKSNTPFDITEIKFEGYGVKLQWNQIYVDNFKCYQVLRSLDGIQFDTLNNVGGSNADMSKTSYTDYVYPLVSKLYYKIIAVGDYHVITPKLGIEIPELKKLDFSPTASFILPEQKKILFFKSNWNDSFIYLYDYENNTLVKQQALRIHSTGMAYGFGKNLQNYEFYFYDGDMFEMQIFNAMDFTKSSFLSFQNTEDDIISDNNGHIFYTSFSNIYNLNRESLTATYYSSSLVSFFKEIHYVEKLNKIIAFDTFDPKIVILTLDETGNVVNETYNQFPDGTGLSYIPGSKYIITKGYDALTYQYESNIIDIENWQSWQLLDENEMPLNISTINARNNVLYVTGLSQNQLFCYSMTDFKLIKKIPLRIAPSDVLFEDDTHLVLISNSYSDRCIIDLMGIPEF
jgi:hypothetical protein